MHSHDFVIVGGLGKTGRRVHQRLEKAGLTSKAVSRSTDTRFDWDDRRTWGQALSGARAAYVTYQPDLAVERAEADIARFADVAIANGIEHIVLLSGRGEKGAERSEARLKEARIDHTILRCAWFDQNFTEGAFIDGILAGELRLPVDAVPEAFVDAEDIADAAIAALTDHKLRNIVFELTGPRLITFAEAVGHIAVALDRQIAYRPVTMEAFVAELRSYGIDHDAVDVMRNLFDETLDGRNVSTSDDLARLIGRPPNSFEAFVRRSVQSGIWSADASTSPLA